MGPVARPHGEVERLDVVALGQRVPAHVSRHEPGYPGRLRDGTQQGLAGLLRVGPDNSTTVRTVPSSVPEQRSPS